MQPKQSNYLQISFDYNLPYPNHRQGRPDIQYHIEAFMDELGYIICKFPIDEMIINPERAYREIYQIAAHEFEQKYIRILQGGIILLDVPDEETDELDTISQKIAFYVLVLTIAFVLFN